MASTLKHLRSSTADKRPTASGLVDGQFAINTASGTPAVFFKDSHGGVVKVGPAHVGASAPNAVPAGSAGNSLGELWVDNSLTTPGLNYYTGSAFVNLTPSGTTAAVGLVELATPAETQTGTDGVRAVTPSGLQSKVSDSTSTTSSTTIASSTAVKSAYDLANAALPKAGGTVTGELLIGTTGSLVFEGTTDNTFETQIAVVDPTADRTITFPNVTGTVVTTGDSGTVTSTMIANDTIVNADINSAAAIVDTKLATISTADKVSVSALNIDGATDIGGALENGDLFIVDDGAGGTNRKTSAFRVSQLTYSGVTGDITIASGGTSAIAAGVIVDGDISASAEIAVSKLADGTARQLLQTDAAGTGVEWASNIDIPGTLDVTSTATFDSIASHPLGAAATPSITFTGDLNTGIYSPGADQVAVTTGGTGRLFIDGSGNIGIGTVAAAGTPINIVSSTGPAIGLGANNGSYLGNVYGTTYRADEHFFLTLTGAYHYYKALVTGPNAVPENVFNDDGANLDFRIAGDTNANLFFVDASTDRVGINDSTPDALLTVNGVASFGAGSAGAPSIAARGDLNTGVYFPGADQVAVATNGTQRITIDSSGRLLVGTATGTNNVRVQENFALVAVGSGNIGGMAITNYGGTAAGSRSILDFQRSRGTTDGSFTVVASGDQLGSIIFRGADGSQFADAAFINCEVDGTPGAGDMPGRLVFSTTADGGSSPSERLRITSAGRVGIGTTSPAYPLDLGTSNDGRARQWFATTSFIGDQGDGTGFQVRALGAGTSGIKFANYANNVEYGRFDSSGRLLVGTSSARTAFGITSNIQSEGTGYDSGSINLVVNNNSNVGISPFINLCRSRGTANGSNSVVQSNDSLGAIAWCGADGSNLTSAAASIRAFVDGTPGANDMPGRLVFSTTADGASSPTERMRIGSDGILYLGATSTLSTIANARLQVRGSNAATFQGDSGNAGWQVVYIHHTNTTGNNLFLEFGTEASIATRGSVDYNRAAGQVRYNVTSDRRLKSDIQPASTALNALSAIQVRSYKWAETGYQVDHGFIAQELNEIAPDAVKVGDDGEEVTDTWAVDNGKLVPLLTKALQEAIAKIETLEARLSTLESA